ncbi:hypothetical protein MUK70_00315 [Dyadobacter chenwenxiniae]|uniref:Uncharacterized protein n=1 Tax=Dyadobacter chenwenxiniae TaxID=2906456 RepID=A0A9X1PNY6_9BACT|nr:hypothetical protein [Dyadobacter chenwenxiniae]MCF0063769.1 hypothetical protein [Dyadobacter chenwenxiniae]UON83445.1 hypothetical protein MUK70_00315 [Dyadobacter chenwenxiniae]
MSINVMMSNIGVDTQDHLKLSVINEKPFKGEAGYYFSLASVPLSHKEYIFVATPLKRGYFLVGGRQMLVGHTLTVRDRKGFSNYFSGEKYNAILTIREEDKTESGITNYRGTLEIQYGSEKRKFKVHGRQYH